LTPREESSSAELIGPTRDERDPGDARERTAFAWTRSALNMAASGTLISRAGFTAHLDALGIASAFAIATMAYLTWRHGRTIYGERGRAEAFRHHQPGALRLLTAATVLTASVAVVVTVAI
jgi:uncharacterized membrane protein YidH (DUF202 family)